MNIRLHHVRLTAPLGQEDVARQFYNGVLGLPELPKPPGLREGGVWFQAGIGQIHIGAEKDGVRPLQQTHTALHVSDAAMLRRLLESLNVKTADALPIAGWTRFYAWDPFGNKLELLQIHEGDA